MVGFTNIVLLVATGENPTYPNDQVIIWDDKQLGAVNYVQFNQPIKSLSYNCEMYIVGMEESVSCMSFDHKTVYEIKTKHHLKGMHAVSQGLKFSVVAPSQKDGFVQVTSFEKDEATFTHLNDLEF